MSKQVLLVILDGWGIAQNTTVSAVDTARTPFFHELLQRFPHSTLQASGEAVGLPEGQMGNSEVGHMNIGAGRVVDQELVRIGKAIRERKLAQVPAVKWADELQIFFQADINKAALRGAYTVDSVALAGGALRRTYTRRPGQRNAPVVRLTVVQQGEVAQQIDANIAQDNALFSARKQLRMQLQNGQLRHYEVTGTQKLVLFDTLRYSAAGTVE